MKNKIIEAKIRKALNKLSEKQIEKLIVFYQKYLKLRREKNDKD